MDRISGANNVLVAGLRMWRDRNQAAGITGTFGNALWFNGVQESILGVVEAADIVPSDADNTQLLLALRFLFGGGGSLGASGWQKLPGGLIVQWGNATFPASGTSAESLGLAFPITFPTAVFLVAGCANGTANSTMGAWPAWSSKSRTTSGFSAVIDTLTAGSTPVTLINQPVPFNYIALGN